MFNAVISAGVSPLDSAIVALAAKVRDEFVDLAEKATARGELTMEQLFDTNYVRVPNSNPERFRTSLCDWADAHWRSEEHTSELQSLMRISYAVFCLKTKNKAKTPLYIVSAAH